MPMYRKRAVRHWLGLSVALSLVLSGCASNRKYYTLLNNGQVIQTASKPKKVADHYVFEGEEGNEFRVPANRVMQIEGRKVAENNPMGGAYRDTFKFR